MLAEELVEGSLGSALGKDSSAIAMAMSDGLGQSEGFCSGALSKPLTPARLSTQQEAVSYVYSR